MSAPSFDLRLADPGVDEPEIRALVGSVAMPGAVSVRFGREPDYFLGTTTMGDPCDVLVARRADEGDLVGMACRAERRTFVNGVETTTGYIGQIRVAEGAQGHWLVQRGARMVRDLSSPGLIYLGVIARENPRARRLLVEHRPPAGLRAERLCGLTSCAILLRDRRLPRTSGFEVRPAADGELSRIQAFLHDQGPRRQFFPAYTLEDLAGGPHLRGLGPTDLMVAWRDDSVCGVLGAWDQAAYKQDIVESYGAGLARARPLYDAAARVLRARPLTRPGHAIPIAFGVCSCVADDDPDVMRALVARCAHHAVRRGKAYLMLGMCDGDPLLDVVRRWPHIAYHSDVYALSFSVNPGDVLDDRTPHIEVGTL